MIKLFLTPLFLHVLLVAVVGMASGRARFKAVRAGRVKRADILNTSSAWPDDVRKIGNNLDNQFQLPTIWYGLTAIVLALGMVDWVLTVLSWGFIASRYLHSFIHTGANTLPGRFYAFLVGFAIVIAMWLWFALRLFAIG
jgi:hypothetical protein